MLIGIDMGHTLSGKGTGAIGCGYKEQDLTRELGKKVIAFLKQEGHSVVDCTCNSAITSNAQLKARVDVANKHNLDLFVSIHFNSCVNDAKGDGKTTGTEVLIYSTSTLALSCALEVIALLQVQSTTLCPSCFKRAITFLPSSLVKSCSL